ncbi:hypothetical protein QTJ16_002765 [Diplocarpon rosae]|uniref:Peptide hydrolase n=1 Tax=Diplocarpon rosae TaxID=946125 RepID=A0AAD9T3X3_9HELO|nr:hypothetical protein QTJ16_002765 [Diplocarpon rosae]
MMHLSSVLPAFVAALPLVAARPPDTTTLETRGHVNPWTSSVITQFPELMYQREFEEVAYRANINGPESWLKTLTEFHNRHHRSSHGAEAGKWLLGQIKSITASNPDIEVTTFQHEFDQPSIIAKIPGTEDELTVIIGTHYDTAAEDVDARAPGANDNGSGVVTHLEALRLFAEAKWQSRNHVEFHFYAGKNGGNLGSKAVLAGYAQRQAEKSGPKVLAFLNQERTGSGPQYRIHICTEYQYTGGESGVLYTHTQKVTEEYFGHYALHDDHCYKRVGDFLSAHDNGFPSVRISAEDVPYFDPERYEDAEHDKLKFIHWFPILRHVYFTIAWAVETSHY